MREHAPPPPSLLVFDFDGTLAASLDQARLIYNAMAREEGWRLIGLEEVPNLRDLPLRAAIARLHVPMTRVPFVMARIRSELRATIPDIRPVAGIPGAIERLHAAGLTLAVVSSNSVENIEAFLRNNDLERFARIEGTSLFGKHRTVKSCMAALGATPRETVYVGDEARDLRCARKAGVRGAGVCWGLNARPVLEACQPDFIFDEPAALADHFTGVRGR